MQSTWSEHIHIAEERLEASGIAEVKTNAEFLAMSIMGIWNRSDLQSYLTLSPSSEELSKYEHFLSRRIDHEPLQYIIGETEFYGLRLFCSPAALIPRPETELLVEEALHEAAALLRTRTTISILDIGTGSGAIILAIASKVPQAQCTGIDISADALMLAEKNCERLGITTVNFHLADFMKTEFDDSIKYDMIVSNPPYIPVEELHELSEEVRDYEPIFALTDNGDGMSFYEKIAATAPKILRAGGLIIVETEYKGAEKVRETFMDNGLSIKRTVKDLLGFERIVIAKTPLV